MTRQWSEHSYLEYIVNGETMLSAKPPISAAQRESVAETVNFPHTTDLDNCLPCNPCL